MTSSTESGRSRITDAVFALVMIAVSAITIWEASKQPRSPFDPVGAAAVPIWTAWIMIGLAVLLLLRVLLGLATQGDAQMLFANARESVDDGPVDRPILTGMTLLLSFAYLVVMPRVGFVVATTVFTFVSGLVLGERTRRSRIVAMAVALVTGIGLDWGFRLLLVALP